MTRSRSFELRPGRNVVRFLDEDKKEVGRLVVTFEDNTIKVKPWHSIPKYSIEVG